MNSEHLVVGAWCPIQCTWSYAIPGPLPPFTSHCHLHCWGSEAQKHSTVPEPGPRLLGSKRQPQHCHHNPCTVPLSPVSKAFNANANSVQQPGVTLEVPGGWRRGPRKRVPMTLQRFAIYLREGASLEGWPLAAWAAPCFLCPVALMGREGLTHLWAGSLPKGTTEQLPVHFTSWMVF